MEKYKVAPIPSFEASRLKELYELNILDTEKEERFDRYTRLAAEIFNVPFSLICLIDVNRQWFKSCFGIDISETPRSVSFCAHAILEREILVIRDATKDKRFAGNPFVLGDPKVRFYAGAILKGPTGKPLGTLCIFDKKPHDFEESDQKKLIQLARLVEQEISYNHHLNQVRNKVETSLYYDNLTGLPNQRLFKERLDQATNTIQDLEQIAVISIKINRLKELENAFGYQTETSVLLEMSKRLKKTLDESDVISHWEEDHFIIFTVIHPQNSSLLIKLEKILKIFRNNFKFKKIKYSLSCKIGISVYPEDDKDSGKLINKAISAMYLQASDANISYRFYSDDATKKLIKQYEIETLLIKAIENDSLEVFYQPKVSIESGQICGVEALCHWRDPNHGEISPDIFIPIAEQSDLIIKLGEWMLRRACSQNFQWQAIGHRRIPVSVNVSKKQLTNKNFPDEIKKILLESKLNSHDLDLEVTESSLINIDEVLTTMNTICQLGVSFSLDDFGTGFSSLSYLQRLPLKTLKIDKSFIKDMTSNQNNAAIVRTVIAMSKTLNLKSVAEGVKTREQLTFLRGCECDQVQGFIFSPPVSAKDFEKLLTKNICLKG